MKRKMMFSYIIVLMAATNYLQAQNGEYRGQQQRPIKALSAEQVASYLEGRGMGLAKAAELNGYPGPKHVLELREALQLTPGQIKQAEQLMAEVIRKAPEIGKKIVVLERELDGDFSEKKGTPLQIQNIVTDIARLNGELRWVHLSAHIRMKTHLSPEQIAVYDHRRGYTSGKSHGMHH